MLFLICQPQLRTTSRGDYYIAAFLSDSSGRINARLWQASEAVFKALGTGWRKGVSWSEVEVENDPTGKPHINVYGRTKEIADKMGGRTFLISITHTDQYAISQVIFTD